MDLLLKGKKALVTGGMSNLGKAICASLASEGVEIYFTYSNSHKRKEAYSFCELLQQRYSVNSTPVCIDLRSRESIQHEIEKTFQETSLDILINNAGIFTVNNQKTLSESDWDEVMDVNVKGLWLMVKYTQRYLENTKGVIVNISSMNASRPGFGGTSHYDASKGAVSAYTRSLAKELSVYGIRVNAVAPGLINSKQLHISAPDLVASYTDRAALHTLVEVDDIAHIVTFLSSKLSVAMTGEIVAADCGYAMM